MGVIRRGRLVGESTVDELLGRPGLRVQAEPLAEAERIAAALPEVERVAVVDGRLRITADPAAAPAINRALVGGGIAVSELVAERASLEEVFLELTQGEEEVES